MSATVLESGVSFQVGLQQDNNFAGSGNRVGVSAMMNDYQKNVSLTITVIYTGTLMVQFGRQDLLQRVWSIWKRVSSTIPNFKVMVRA